MTQQTLVDTLRVFRPDSATNAGIYYHETIKLMENSNWWSVSVPIFVALLSLIFTIGYSFYQLKKERKESRLKVKPILDHFIDHTDNKLKLEIHNKGLGVGIIDSIFFEYCGFRTKNILNIVKKITNDEPEKFIKPESQFSYSPTGFSLTETANVLIFNFIFEENIDSIIKTEFGKINLLIHYRNIYDEILDTVLIDISATKINNE